MTNLEIAEILHKVSAAYQILGENRFRIIAYDRAADSIEHLTSDLKDYWKDGKLDEVSGVGKTIAEHIDELYKTGKNTHWESVFAKVPEAVFPLLLVPGIGPKKAHALVTILKLKNEQTAVLDLEKAAKAGKIEPLDGFGKRSQDVILDAIAAFKKGQIKENRMPLPYADAVATEVMDYVAKGGGCDKIDVLGSLRRKVSTIGDIDFAVATTEPEKVIERFITFPHQKLIEKGPSGATLLLANGKQVDMRVQTPRAYGAMLQYFTGSKSHNIQLREYGLRMGKSLNEHGIKDIKTGKLHVLSTEKAFYGELGLEYIEPELREGREEIVKAKTHTLPNLIDVNQILGDLHVHSTYDLHSSHDLGSSTIHELLETAMNRGYEYVGFSDHNPSVSKQSSTDIVQIMKKRKTHYEQQYYSYTKTVHKNKKVPSMFIMCEVDIQPDGTLALPNEAFEYVDAVVVSLHSAFTQSRTDVTKRIITAFNSHPKVRIFGHPTGRLLGSREGVDAEWKAVFAVAKERNIALEINSFPERLDLPDGLVAVAKEVDVKFCINTDAHDKAHMNLMPYGVSVARRGGLTKDDVVNTYAHAKFLKWLYNKK
ncbi:MAG: PHP domain-containing protein [Patescibacteria group bacterium]